MLIFTAAMKKIFWIWAAFCIGTACQSPVQDTGEGLDNHPQSRAEWEHMRLQNPETGLIPRGIRARELAYAATLPVHDFAARSGGSEWILPGGPYNIGGRTRAFALDITNPQIMLAGGVSGGMWRSTDGGVSWKMTTAPDQLRSVTCLIQDARPSRHHIWYYGSGEGRGNSAGMGFSAYYEGDGIFKSLDSGKSWSALPSTVSAKPQSTELFDRMWNLALDPSTDTATILYAATYKHIMRSADGGQTWDSVLGGRPSSTDTYTDILITTGGAKYATLSSKVLNKGIWRSSDGINWTNINPPFMPVNYNRIVMAKVPQNENSVYFFANTPGAGKSSMPSGLGGEMNSLWKYTWKAGDGSGTNGIWENLSAQLPQDSSTRRNLYTQGCYNQAVSVSPHDSDLLILGGQNIFRNTAGWRIEDSNRHMGGYNPQSSTSWDYRYENSHPDFHVLVFHPTQPGVLYAASDGGIHRTNDVKANHVQWTDLSMGYTTSQFYHVTLDRHHRGSHIVLGGMQDNSTFWTNDRSRVVPWKMLNLGDGSFCAMASDQKTYYTSRQYASMIKEEVDAAGNVQGFTRIDPQTNASYLFINPFELDPKNDNTMYLGMRGRVMRNTTLHTYALDSSMDRKTTGWSNVPINGFPSGANVTAMHCPRNAGDYLYLGTNLKQFYRITSPDKLPTATFANTTGFATGGYVSDITTDPRNPLKVLLSFSNYEVHSLWYSEDGGENWTPVAGNLEAPQPAGVPSGFGLGDGPSVRSIEIIPVSNGTIYLAGTSTGLFATTALNGEQTVWIKQSPQTIGNAIVESMDCRFADGFVVIATHGNGVFTGYLNNVFQVDPNAEVVSVAEKGSGKMCLYPNPATHEINILSPRKPVSASMYSADGKFLSTKTMKGLKPFLNVADMPRGLMVIVITDEFGYKQAGKVLLH